MFRKLKRKVSNWVHTPPRCSYEDWLRYQGVDVLGPVDVDGQPTIIRWGNPRITICEGVTLQSNPLHNDAGIIHPCTLSATSSDAEIYIGRHSGLSGVLICAQKRVHIGEYVWLGANVTIYDTDFHPINPYERFCCQGLEYVGMAEVVIDNYAWIGANVMILKGVHIGRGAVVGAGSVVTQDVPELTVYAGNPARFVRKIEMTAEQYTKLFENELLESNR